MSDQAKDSFRKAREQFEAGNFSSALELYLFAFDNGYVVEGWRGFRLSVIPSEIAKLGQRFAPALDALRSRRDSRENLIRNGESDFDVVVTWLSLNRFLGEKHRELLLLSELQTKKILNESVKYYIIFENLDSLLERREYSTLSEYFDDFGSKFLYKVFSYENSVLFNKGSRLKVERSGNLMRELGAQVYELALALEKDQQAHEISMRVLFHHGDVESFNILINSARRAGRTDKIRELTKQAKSQLPKEEFQKLKQIKRGKGT